MTTLNSCNTCKFFKHDEKTNTNVCRRFPPIMGLDFQRGAWVTNFVVIGNPQMTWCGEWQLAIVAPGNLS